MVRTRIIAGITLLILIGFGLFLYNNEASLSGKSAEDIEHPFRLGLDLAGGAQITYRADVSELDEKEVPDALQTLKTVIERRINPLGQQETNVQIQDASFANDGEYRLVVELPGVVDVGVAKDQIGKTPILEFRLGPTNEEVAGIDFENIDFETFDLDALYTNTALSGRFLDNASLQFVPSGGAGGYGAQTEPVVVLAFNEEGEKLFSDITREYVGRELAIFLDGAMISNPIIREEITGGEAVISGVFSAEEAKELARDLNFGALPVPIEVIGTQTIGATLGEEAIKDGVFAGLIGFLVLALFFIVWYRLPGLVAVFALSFYALIMFALIKIIPITLTASGIAGFIISLGVAVDANVLISERLREELKSGKTLQEGIKEGFDRAWLSIRDSNISGLIIAIILFWFGSNLIKGFAMTLGLGIIVSMFSAITLTKVFLLTAAGKSNSKRMRFLFSSGFKK